MSAELSYLFEETRFCSNYLVEKDFCGLLDLQLQEASPIDDSFWQRFDYRHDAERMLTSSPMTALRIIEADSPALLNRDLASIALARQGQYTQKRFDRVAGMIGFIEDHWEKQLEACLAICHWRNWHQKPSQWLHWEGFFELLDQGTKDERYIAWSAYAYIWALVQNGGKISIMDDDYQELLWHFQTALEDGQNHGDNDLRVACRIALGQLSNLQVSGTFADEIATL
jgi:hypothetical protein